MTSFNFREEDKEGKETLEVISGAVKFNKWMYETIRPFCSGNILEIGSGIGNISRFFLEDGAEITLSDIRNTYCEYLKKEFSGYDNLQQVLTIDLTDADFESKFREMHKYFDTIFALNVVEHIENDSLAIKNAHSLLKEGGKLVILVPAYMFLYNRFDRELGHYRRYTRKSLTQVYKDQAFDIIHTRYFNFAGMAGWYVSGKIQQNKTIPGSQMALYNRLVPVFRLFDRLLFNSAGLSVIVVGRKK